MNTINVNTDAHMNFSYGQHKLSIASFQLLKFLDYLLKTERKFYLIICTVKMCIRK